MKKSSKLLIAFVSTLSVFSLTACSSNQTLHTIDGRKIITDGKPQVDNDTGLVSYKNAETGRVEQINRNQIKSMKELEN